MTVADEGCYPREYFDADFKREYEKLFGMPPTTRAKRNALRDYRAGNTGWEAARNAVARAKDRARRADTKAWRDAQVLICAARSPTEQQPKDKHDRS